METAEGHETFYTYALSLSLSFPCSEEALLFFSPSSFSFLPCLFLPLYFPDWRFHFGGGGGGSSSDLPSASRIPSQCKRRGSFTLQFGYFVSYKYLMPFWKSHLTAEARCIWYRYRDPPVFWALSLAESTVTSTPGQFPRTLYFKVFTFYRFFANSGNLGRYTQCRATCA